MLLETFLSWPRIGNRTPRRGRGRGYRASLETLEVRRVLAATLTNTQPTFNFTIGQTAYIGLEGKSDINAPVTYSATSDSPNLTVSTVTTGRSIKINVSGVDSANAPFTGDIVLRLFEDLEPQTTARIIQLATQSPDSFYKGLLFHRVIKDFMVQGGDPQGTGSGGSGTKFSDEFNLGLTFNSQGLLAMANSGDDTNDSQFFITDVDQPLSNQRPTHLNFQHSIFGIMTSGFDVYRKLIGTPVDSNDRPLTNAVMNSVTVFTDNQSGLIKITGPASGSVSGKISVTASDGSPTTASQDISVNSSVASRNNPAFLGPVSNLTTTKATPVSFTVTGSDTEVDPLTFKVFDPTSFTSNSSVGTPPKNVSVTQETTTVGGLPATKFTLTPTAGFSGTIQILVGVRDDRSFFGDGLNVDAKSHFDTQAITLTVAGDPPTLANADSIVVATDSTGASYNVLANDFLGTGGGKLVVQTVGAASHGTVAVASDQKTVTYTPVAGYSGSDSFTYTIKDDLGNQSTGTVTATVGGATVLRARNPNSNTHFYTADPAELAAVVKSGFVDESSSTAGWRAMTTNVSPLTVVYRLYNKLADLQYLTESQGERDFLLSIVPSNNPDSERAGWREDTSTLFLFSEQQPGSVEVFHLYDNATGSHLFTENPTTRDSVLNAANSTWVQHKSLGFAFPPKSAASPSIVAPLYAGDITDPSSSAVDRLVKTAVAPVSQPISIPDGSQLPDSIADALPDDPISGGATTDLFDMLPDPIPQHPLEQAIPIDFHKAIDDVFSSPEIAVA